MSPMPNFTYSDYKNLLSGFQRNGFNLCNISNFDKSPPKKIGLRHDVDFFLEGTLKIAEIENNLNISSTYYVLVNGYYNLLLEENKKIIFNLLEMGHEIGLHYDLSSYPTDYKNAYDQLIWEVKFLEKLARTHVTTIVSHQPFINFNDPFVSLSEYLNPSVFTDIVYISDSCRAWRDDTLA